MNKTDKPITSLRGIDRKILINWLIGPIVGGFVIACILCPNCIENRDYGNLLQDTILSAIYWLVLANGNDLIHSWLDRKYSWIGQPVQRTVAAVTFTLTFTVIASLIIIYVFIEYYLAYDFFKILEQHGLIELVTPAVIITVIISLTMHGRGFLIAWRESALDVERLKNKNLTSQYESLKNQVNPHFLFNSLNALSSLVYIDQDKAVEFIRKLADVYRYVLDHQFEEVVPLKTEMEFVKSFIYLNKIRFGDNLTVNIYNEDHIHEEDYIPPIAVQMLLENAFKHNVVSKDKPLNVDIRFNEKELTVTNNVNLKTEKESSSGVGLNNIKSRYAFLTDHKVQIIVSSDSFEVKLPILKMQGK